MKLAVAQNDEVEFVLGFLHCRLWRCRVEIDGSAEEDQGRYQET